MRINSFGTYRCLGYSTVSITTAEANLGALARPAGANGAFIRIIANASVTGNQPVAYFTVPVQPTPTNAGVAPNANTGEPVWNADMIALWPDQLAAKIISADGLTHSARIQWVVLQ
jgi:hypothetical protein